MEKLMGFFPYEGEWEASVTEEDGYYQTYEVIADELCGFIIKFSHDVLNEIHRAVIGAAAYEIVKAYWQ